MIAHISKIEISTLKSIKIVFFDFDGVFTNNSVYVREDGLETVKSSRSDGLGLARLESAGIKMMIISTEKNIVVKKRAEKLGIECIHGSTDKKNEIEMICKEHSINPNDAIFVGNDINDIPALNFVGIPIGVADSYEEIYPHISFITKKNGGEGAVREICDHIYFSLKKTNGASIE
tara:strand:+ start:124 stop:651 length:528 start_codon:yes stop_codon:yes gene_type:complete